MSNAITVIGNLTREPDLRFTASGQANTKFGIAVNRRWRAKDSGEWQEATSYFDVVCWAQLAENVCESCPKGTRVIVTGRLEQRSFEDRTGAKRSVVEIVADDVAPSLKWATAQVARAERSGEKPNVSEQREMSVQRHKDDAEAAFDYLTEPF
jgi:single-strand DNA-binding protein